MCERRERRALRGTFPASTSRTHTRMAEVRSVLESSINGDGKKRAPEARRTDGHRGAEVREWDWAAGAGVGRAALSERRPGERLGALDGSFARRPAQPLPDLAAAKTFQR